MTLRLRGTLSFGAQVVPVAIDCAARRLAIVGPSGVGKSSLVRALVGLSRLGTVAVRGAVWEDATTFVPPWQRGAGFVPQDATLLPHASVRENLAWGVSAHGALPLSDLADALGISHLLDRRPRHLSGGERQRVALGRALSCARTALVLDEPFSALDADRRASVATFVDDEARRRDLPVVLVSHDARDVERLADDVVTLTGR